MSNIIATCQNSVNALKTLLRIGLAIAALGGGTAACATALIVLGCHKPMGYYGGNTPEPDRTGGPSWFLCDASPEERLAYYVGRCREEDASLTSQTAATCAELRIAENAHSYCVLYYLRPTQAAKEAEREANFANCKRRVLDLHEL